MSGRFRRPLRAVVAAAVVLGLVTATATAATAETTSTGDTTTTGDLHRAAQRWIDAGVPGVAVRVDDGRRTTELVRQNSWSRRDHRLRLGDEYKMASNTKVVTGTLVLQQVHEGRLSLDDPANRWLPRIPDGITVRMLLNQTSGLFDFLNDPRLTPMLLGRDSKHWTPRELLALAFDHPPLFPPGERWNYSNTNYISVGLILEAVSGKRYADLVRERIIDRLGMQHTYLSDPAGFRGRHAHGYEPDAEHLGPYLPPGTPVGEGFAGPRLHDHVQTEGVDVSASWAAGGLISTAEEWPKFLRALFDGRLLPAHLLAEMKQAVPQGNGDGYGLGLMEINTPCGTVWGHSGGFPGYRSHNYVDATGTRTVTVLGTTTFKLHAPDAAAGQEAMVDAAVCELYGR
ncbi:serine hydrolase domain-containing protein [Saccharothrix sp. NPDC042600]|uniref:serine hydrolase domain-containing protein n=1 Tax=Saccharothrix TaxID=2071 RepID=UPI00340C9EDD|nr:serine hydrolase domain-containing protein [Saccharothrix mutabilis subsp. capreolus]